MLLSLLSNYIINRCKQYKDNLFYKILDTNLARRLANFSSYSHPNSVS